MPVPSLAGLCRKTIWANIDELSYVSNLPYWKVRDILKHVKTASQLAVIEDYSPQIVGEDAELWEAFCRRDFPVPVKRKDYQPENPRSWRQVYERYAEEEREAEALALAQLGATYAGINKAKMANKTSIGDPRHLPKAPISGGFARSRGKGPGPGSATLSFGGGARTTNAVKKAKKEALEVAARKRLSVPKGVRSTANLAKVTRAPESMKTEFRIKAQPKFIPPGAPAVAKRPRETGDEREQMEARLLAAKRSKVQPKVMSDEELRSGSSKSMEENQLAAAAQSESRPSTTPKKPRSLFSRAHNTSYPQSKVTVKTVGRPTSNAAPEKPAGVPKTKAGLPGSIANNSSSSTARTGPPSTQRPSRPETSRINNLARRGDDLSPITRVSSPGYEDFKLSKMAPRRASRSPSVASSVFGTPEPEVSEPRGRRSSYQSNSSRSSSPLAPPSTRPAKRAGTPPIAATALQGKSSSPPKRRLDEVAAGGSSAAATSADGGAAAPQPPIKKKKVDIFMRRKR
ncbi:rna polymerase ii transcription factor siii subunit a [Diaporthe amygdali]|uniref:rna polymerase ii transcription factor siii subunit a n=1 Tax=Phomopsis amygdali TaxID=1214568 RepID=UPI0022FE6DAE|nr:rna polymerase ii transcription factor siii subunit a [Diaporthe amygdali]KAJ0121403.1 rna polymerase ii transcription factor siii subunit a [Diaporthe amygdali]